MQLGYIGLGKMGHNMVSRLIEKKHDVFAFDKNDDSFKNTNSLKELCEKLKSPRVIWLMVPYQAVDGVLGELMLHLSRGDTIIDGGNSPYKESMRRAKELSSSGIKFLDIGVSGGPGGALAGACLMIGGELEDFNKLEPLFKDLSADGGYGYMGKHGAGHFVKMVHNGIEYGMMQAIAEGFTVMKNSEFNLNLENIADLYNHRSVIESRLVNWLKEGFNEFGQDMDKVSGSVASSGEGQWTVDAAKELGVPVRVIEDALRFRLDSKNSPSYTGKLLSVMRNRFGGHKVN